MRNKANKQMQIEAGRACLIATSWAMYKAREAAGVSVTDDDNATELLAEVEAATAAVLVVVDRLPSSLPRP